MKPRRAPDDASMRTRSCLRRPLARLGRDEEGIGTVELLVAILVITVGILAFAGTIDVSRGLTNQSEVKEVAIHQAQREVERIQSLGFTKVAHPTGTNFALAGDSLASR